jgi:hypothetical protein
LIGAVTRAYPKAPIVGWGVLLLTTWKRWRESTRFKAFFANLTERDMRINKRAMRMFNG